MGTAGYKAIAWLCLTVGIMCDSITMARYKPLVEPYTNWRDSIQATHVEHIQLVDSIKQARIEISK